MYNEQENIMNTNNLGVGKLVFRMVWDHETAGSSPATQTEKETVTNSQKHQGKVLEAQNQKIADVAQWPIVPDFQSGYREFESHYLH